MVISKSIRSCVLATLACGLSFVSARAAWDPDGNRVSFHVGQVIEHTAIPFGDGGVLVVWSHYDPANYQAGSHVRAQALDDDGNAIPGWPAEGVALTIADGTQRYPAPAPDGAGGAYVTWLGHPGGANALMIQRLTGAGTVAPGWPATGRALAATSPVGVEQIEPDGAGGVYVGWSQSVVPETPDLRLLRLGADGEVAAGWPVAGLRLVTRPWVWDLALAEDGAGGVYAAWDELSEDFRQGRVVLRRFTAGGTPHPAWPAAGVAVAKDSPARPQLVTDGAGGLYAAWGMSFYLCPLLGLCPDCRCPNTLYATHVDANGALVPGWPAAGIVFGEGGVVASDAAGGLLVGMVAYVETGGHTEIQGRAARVRPDGAPAPGWSLAGNPVCSERRALSAPALVADGTGGTFASWVDYRTFEAVLYVTHLTSSGSIAGGWPETGSIGSVAAVSPDAPLLVNGRGGEAIVVWVDRRSGSPQLYAESTRPGPAGPPAPRLGLGFTVTDIHPNPARGAFWATVSLPEPGIATLELFDVMGRRLESHRIAGGRPGVAQLNTSGKLTAGIYHLRLSQGNLPAGQRTSFARVAIVP